MGEELIKLTDSIRCDYESLSCKKMDESEALNILVSKYRECILAMHRNKELIDDSFIFSMVTMAIATFKDEKRNEQKSAKAQKSLSEKSLASTNRTKQHHLRRNTSAEVSSIHSQDEQSVGTIKSISTGSIGNIHRTSVKPMLVRPEINNVEEISTHSIIENPETKFISHFEKEHTTFRSKSLVEEMKQPKCHLCHLFFENESKLTRHKKYSDMHHKNVVLHEEMIQKQKQNHIAVEVEADIKEQANTEDELLNAQFSSPKHKASAANLLRRQSTWFGPVTEEGTEAVLIHSGSKSFWQTGDIVDVVIYMHVEQKALEVVCWNPDKLTEYNRLYFNISSIIKTIGHEAFERKLHRIEELNKVNAKSAIPNTSDGNIFGTSSSNMISASTCTTTSTTTPLPLAQRVEFYILLSAFVIARLYMSQDVKGEKVVEFRLAVSDLLASYPVVDHIQNLVSVTHGNFGRALHDLELQRCREL